MKIISHWVGVLDIQMAAVYQDQGKGHWLEIWLFKVQRRFWGLSLNLSLLFEF